MSDVDLLKAIAAIRDGWELKERVRTAEEGLAAKNLEQAKLEIEQAQQQAVEIIKTAEREAASVQDSARMQAEVFMQEKEQVFLEQEERKNTEFAKLEAEIKERLEKAKASEEAGFELGHDKGYGHGYEEGLSQFRGMLEGLESVLTTIAADRENVYLKNLEQIQDFISCFAEKILGPLSETEVSHVLSNIEKALKEVERATQIKVVVSTHDFEAISAVKDKYDALFSPTKQVELLEDKTLTPGGCMLETELGNVDATIESQLTLLWLELNTDG